MNPKSTELQSTFPLSFPAASSLHRHPLHDVARISTLADPPQPASALHPLPDVDPHLQAMADPRETLIHTDQDLFRGHGPQDATELAQDPFHRVLDRHPEDEQGVETALGAMVAAGGEEVQVIAAIAVMMIEAEAAAVEVVSDVRTGGHDRYSSAGVWDGLENCTIEL